MKRIISLLLAALLFGMLPITGYAHEALDLDQRGSIIVTMTFQKKVVSGGDLTLYKVGEVNSEDGNYFFTYTKEFSECSIPVTDPSSSKLSDELDKIRKEKGLNGLAKRNIGENGQVIFGDLELGLYLVVQETAASGYHTVKPFVVSVPSLEDGSYIYDIDASPKVELEKASTPEQPTPSNPKPIQNNQPKTGDTDWRLILAASGVFLSAFCIVIWSYRRKKEQ